MEETENIIEVQDVTMRFNLSEERTDTLKEYFIKLVSGRLHYTPFLALDRVSFRVKRGEALALIGKNGSGKSTMLKILAGILYPTEGAVKVKGTIAPLIELGAGFDLELTGRENIYMNGAILGHDRQFMDLHFQEIVDFSELDDFIDVPLKNYSSGMIARLGFSVATIVKADILVVDEVLAVGDFRFQEKCHRRIAQLLENGTTLLFVSHNAAQVKALCPKSLWLDHGKVMAFVNTEEVFALYENAYRS